MNKINKQPESIKIIKQTIIFKINKQKIILKIIKQTIIFKIKNCNKINSKNKII